MRDVGTLCYKDCPHTVLVDYVETYADEQCKSLGAFAMDAVRFSGDSGFQHRDNAFPFPFPGDDGDTDSLFDSDSEGDYDPVVDDSTIWNDQIPNEPLFPVPEIDDTSSENSDDGNEDQETESNFTDPSHQDSKDDLIDQHEYRKNHVFYDRPGPNYGFYHDSDVPLRYVPSDHDYYRDAFEPRHRQNLPPSDESYSREGFERDALRRISPEEFYGYGPQQYYPALPSYNYEQYYDEEDDGDSNTSSPSGPIFKLREKLRRRLGWVSANYQDELGSDDLNMLLAQEPVMDAKFSTLSKTETVLPGSYDFKKYKNSGSNTVKVLADQNAFNVESDAEDYESSNQNDLGSSDKEYFSDYVEPTEQSGIESDNLDYISSEIDGSEPNDGGTFELQENSDTEDTTFQDSSDEAMADSSELKSDDDKEDEITDLLEYSEDEATSDVSDINGDMEDYDTEKSDSNNYEETDINEEEVADLFEDGLDLYESDEFDESDTPWETDDDADNANTSESTGYDNGTASNDDNGTDNSENGKNPSTLKSPVNGVDETTQTEEDTLTHSNTLPVTPYATSGGRYFNFDIDIAAETAAISNLSNLPSSVEYYPRPGMTTQVPHAEDEAALKDEQEMQSMKSMLSSQRKEKAQESARLEMLEKEKQQRESENEQEIHKHVSDEVTKERDTSDDNHKAESFLKSKLSVKDHSSSGGKLNILAPLLVVSSGSLFLWLSGVSDFAIGGYIVITGAVALSSYNY